MTILQEQYLPETKRASQIGIIGFGVVGSATARGLKSLGHEVYINDIKDLRQYKNEFYVLQPYDLSKTDLTLITVPTPTKPLNLEGKIDLSILENVFQTLGEQLKYSNKYHVFTIRSTVPPGTTRGFGEKLEKISGKRLGRDFGMAMNPEFLRAYNSFQDFQNPKLTVIGQYDERSGDVVKKLYESLNTPIKRVGLEDAEMIKYTHNLFNAAKISFFNEIWDVCNQLGVDFEKVRGVVTKTAESCWNPEYGTHAGLPYGGTCLPKDTIALHSYLKERGFNAELLEAVIKVNEKVTNNDKKKKVPDLYFQRRKHESYDNLNGMIK